MWADSANQPTIMTYDEPETPSSESAMADYEQAGYEQSGLSNAYEQSGLSNAYEQSGLRNGCSLQLSPLINIQPPSPMVLSPEDDRSLLTSSENELDLMMTANEQPQMCPPPPALSQQPLDIDTSVDSDVLERPLSPTDFTLHESAPDTPLTAGDVTDRRPPSPSVFTLVADGDELREDLADKTRPYTASMAPPTNNAFTGSSFTY